jgi:hypothetical protein
MKQRSCQKKKRMMMRRRRWAEYVACRRNHKCIQYFIRKTSIGEIT